MRKEQAECLRTLRTVGYKWNIETPVGHNLELHMIVDIQGRQHIWFVAELDSYGNVEFGLYDESRTIRTSRQTFNADGEVIGN